VVFSFLASDFKVNSHFIALKFKVNSDKFENWNEKNLNVKKREF